MDERYDEKKLGIGLATLYRKMEGTDDTAGKR